MADVLRCAHRAARVALVALLTLVALAVPVAASAATPAPLTPGPVATPAPLTPGPVATAADDVVELVRFVGDGCPRCAEQDEWLERSRTRWPDLRVVDHEVWHDADGRELFVRTGERLGFRATSVPTTVLGERVWIGWTDEIAEDVERWLDRAAAGEAVPAGTYGQAGAGTCDDPLEGCTADEDTQDAVTIDVPLVGEVDLGSQSLLASTVIIGFVDGVNPCSLWAISVLLTIVVRTGDRRRIVAIGATFLLVTAAMYALYMVGIYSALTVAAHLGAIQAVVAVVAGLVGAFAVKDYFAFKKGPSLTIADSAKPGLYRRMRDAARHRRLGPALLATAALGVAVSLLETPCTAGFPVLWTGMLQANGVAPAEAVALFGAYMVPFLLDEAVVVVVAVVTMRAAKLQEKHGEVLKLVAGVTMLALAGAMVVDPEIMQDPLRALLLFVAAFAVTAIVHAVTTLVRGRQGSGSAPGPVRAAP